MKFLSVNICCFGLFACMIACDRSAQQATDNRRAVNQQSLTESTVSNNNPKSQSHTRSSDRLAPTINSSEFIKKQKNSALPKTATSEKAKTDSHGQSRTSASKFENILPYRHLYEAPVLNKEYPAIIRNPYLNSMISTYRGVAVALDNDLFNNTDRYYTNGIHIVFHSPAFAFWQINYLLPVGTRNYTEYNSIELHHAMYTPYTTKQPPVLKDERPYAATLLWRYTRKAVHHQKHLIRSASIDIGVIGKGAFGSSLQQSVHAALPTNHEPLGWDTQIRNDIIFNYHYTQVNSFVHTGQSDLYTEMTGSLGTHLTNAGASLGFRLHSQNIGSSFHETTGTFKSGKSWSYLFDIKTGISFVAYNSTLNGGLLNRKNIYVLLPGETERILHNASLTLSVRYYNMGINLSQYYVSKEFRKGYHHFWAQIGITVDF